MALDGLRGLAILIVLLSHSGNLGLVFADFLDFQKTGKIGVYLFFVLSAYLLDRQIAIAYVTKKAGSLYWKNYFLRRFLRIYPLYTISLFTFLGITLLGFPTVIQNPHEVIQHLLLRKGESIFWSVPVEFKYYILSPFIIFFCHRFLKWKMQQLLWFFLILTVFSIAIELNYELALISTLRYLPIFLAGTFVAVSELLLNHSKKQLPGIITHNSAGIIALSIILITTPYYFKLIFGVDVNFHHAIFFMPYAILWSVLLVSVKHGHGFISRMFKFKPLRFLGTISYSLYLFHMPVLQFLQADLGIPQGLKIYIFFALSILFSSFSYLLIELPLSKIKLIQKPIREADIEKNK